MAPMAMPIDVGTTIMSVRTGPMVVTRAVIAISGSIIAVVGPGRGERTRCQRAGSKPERQPRSNSTRLCRRRHRGGSDCACGCQNCQCSFHLPNPLCIERSVSKLNCSRYRLLAPQTDDSGDNADYGVWLQASRFQTWPQSALVLLRPAPIADGSHQPIGLDQHTNRTHLRAKREADHNECR